MFMRMVGGNGATSLVARELDAFVRHLVDDVERLERPALPRGLLLDDAYLLLAVHRLGLGRRAARAVVQRSSPLHEAPMHSGQSAYNDRLQQRHPLMRMRSDLCEETLGRSRRRGAAAAAGVRRHHFLRRF